ncbi:IS110 family transposase [Cognatiluteimonas sedimenti]|uniref:IS110 family transposase n=1 Tax=Cognatiluteimonas sedimenti TaxID=2927791 RepID=UPI0028F400F1|nr:transposase [Lysobacter sedimenti]
MGMTAVGLDVGKAALNLAVDGQPGVVRFANTEAGMGKLLRHLGRLESPRVVLEATGGYEEPLLEACGDAGFWVARVNPRQARKFARATGELAKTDAIDARAPVRAALYMATLSAVRWDPTMRDHYQQLRARGKLG